MKHDETAFNDIAQIDELLREERAARAKGFVLTLLSGPEKGRQVRLIAGETTLGRGEECGLRLSEPAVSRLHATVILDDSGGLSLRDAGSRNGTFVDGTQIMTGSTVELRDGGRIRLGDAVAMKVNLIDEDEVQFQTALYEAAVKDPLTGAYNKKYLRENLERELALAQRHGLPLSVIVFDIDHFKKINDTYGHTAGDHVLVRLAQVVGLTLRVEDLFCRFGGEEFVVVAKHLSLASAGQLAERIRTLVAETEFVGDGQQLRVTVSAGVASTSAKAYGGVDAIIRDADQALYEAKRAGRNATRLALGDAGAEAALQVG